MINPGIVLVTSALMAGYATPIPSKPYMTESEFRKRFCGTPGKAKRKQTKNAAKAARRRNRAK